MLAPKRLFRDGVAYGPLPRQRLDLYRPAGIGPFPVLVFLYGGNWSAGDRAIYRFLGGAFAAAGWLVVIPDYRLYPGVRYPAFLQDCARAVAWTRHHIGDFDGAVSPPVLMGHSAGAYNAAMLTLDTQWLGAEGLSPSADLAGTIGLAGPYDFLPLHDPMLVRLFDNPSGYEATQPIAHVDGRNPPMLLLSGKADRTVKPYNTHRLAVRVRALGGTVEERLYPGIDHLEIIGAIAGTLRFLAPTFDDCLAFMNRVGAPARDHAHEPL